MLAEKDEIVSKKIGLNDRCGIYFLISGEEIVYVGRSYWADSRVFQHKNAERIPFDSWSFISCDETELVPLEKLYIMKYLPLWNRDHECMSAKGIVIVPKRYPCPYERAPREKKPRPARKRQLVKVQTPNGIFDSRTDAAKSHAITKQAVSQKLLRGTIGWAILPSHDVEAATS